MLHYTVGGWWALFFLGAGCNPKYFTMNFHLFWYFPISIDVAAFHNGLGKVGQIHRIIILKKAELKTKQSTKLPLQISHDCTFLTSSSRSLRKPLSSSFSITSLLSCNPVGTWALIVKSRIYRQKNFVTCKIQKLKINVKYETIFFLIKKYVLFPSWNNGVPALVTLEHKPNFNTKRTIGKWQVFELFH